MLGRRTHPQTISKFGDQSGNEGQEIFNAQLTQKASVHGMPLIRKSWRVLEAKCYVYMNSPLASNSAHVRLHAAEPRRMYDFRKYAH